MKAFLALTVPFVLAACATSSSIVALGGDTLFVSKEAGTGFSGIAGLKNDVLAQAGAHCGKQGKSASVISVTESQPPYIFGNYPRVEVTFRCA